MTPAAAARLVFTRTMLIDTASAALANANCDPPLNPNQPNHKMKTPSVTSSMFEGGVGLTVPSRRNLPSLGPTTSMPASAAQPPVLCTMVEPAKSWNPRSLSQPPPHVHAPTIGYMNAVSNRVNSKNDHIFTLSAKVPDTMEAAVATKTIWKNQSDITE